MAATRHQAQGSKFFKFRAAVRAILQTSLKLSREGGVEFTVKVRVKLFSNVLAIHRHDSGWEGIKAC